MLTEKQIFRLIRTYCSPVLVLAGTGTASAAGALALTSYGSIAATFCILCILKAATTAIAVLLFKSMRKPEEDYFYINIGQHPVKLLKTALCADAAIYILACSLIILLRYVINL